MTDPNVLIRQLQGALNGSSIRGGSIGVTWPGGTPTADTATVTHRLSVRPVSVQITPTGTLNVRWHVQNITTTTFDLVVMTWDASSPAAATERFFYWAVIG